MLQALTLYSVRILNILVFSLLTALSAAGQGPVLRGRVVDAHAHTPVQAAAVGVQRLETLNPAPSAAQKDAPGKKQVPPQQKIGVPGGTGTAYTDDRGALVLPLPAPGRYVLQIRLLGYDSYTDTLALFGRDTLLPPIHLHPSHVGTEPVELAPVTIIDHVEAPLNEAIDAAHALTSTRVDAAYIRQFGATTLAQTLARLPGVSYRGTGVGISKPVLRGFSSNRVVVLADGVKHEGQQWGDEHGLEVDPFGVGSVEILKGPAALRYGSDAIGGVLAIQTLAAPDYNTVRGELQTEYQSVTQGVGTSATATIRHNRWWASAQGGYRNAADYAVPADSFTYNRFVLPLENQRLKNTAQRLRTGQFAVGHIQQRASITLRGSHYDQRVGFFPGAHGIPRAYQLTDDGNRRDINLPHQEIRHTRLAVEWRQLVGENGTLDVVAGYQRNQRDEFSRPHAHGDEYVATSNQELGLRLHTGSVNADYAHKFSSKLMGHVGFAAQVQRNRRSGFEFILADFNRTQYGTYTTLEYRPAQRVVLHAGARWDGGRLTAPAYTEAQRNAAGDTVGFLPRTPALARRFGNVSGAVGAAVTVWNKLNVKANLGSAFRFPQPIELLANGIHHGTFRHEVGDASLNPERGLQADLGLHWNPAGTGKLQASVTPFYAWFPNYIFLTPQPIFSPLPEGGQLYAYEETEATVWGVELRAIYRPHRRVNLGVTGEFLRNKNRATGLPLPFQPPSTLLLEAGYRLPLPGRYKQAWWVGADLQLVEQQDRVVRNEPQTPGYVLFNLHSSFDLLPGGKVPVQLTLQVRNVVNTNYLRHLSTWRLLNLPEAGRNIVLGLRVPIRQLR